MEEYPRPQWSPTILCTLQLLLRKLATGCKCTPSGRVIYVPENHVSYCPLPHPGNWANFCQLIFGKERGRNKEGLIIGVFCVCVCVNFQKDQWVGPNYLKGFHFYIDNKQVIIITLSILVNRWTIERNFRRPSMTLRIDEVQQDMGKGIQRSAFSNAESSKLLGKASEKNTKLL